MPLRAGAELEWLIPRARKIVNEDVVMLERPERFNADPGADEGVVDRSSAGLGTLAG